MTGTDLAALLDQLEHTAPSMPPTVAVAVIADLVAVVRAVLDLDAEVYAEVQALAEEAEGTPLEDLRRNQLLARALGKASVAQRIRAAVGQALTGGAR